MQNYLIKPKKLHNLSLLSDKYSMIDKLGFWVLIYLKIKYLGEGLKPGNSRNSITPGLSLGLVKPRVTWALAHIYFFNQH